MTYRRLRKASLSIAMPRITQGAKTYPPDKHLGLCLTRLNTIATLIFGSVQRFVGAFERQIAALARLELAVSECTAEVAATEAARPALAHALERAEAVERARLARGADLP